MWGKTNLLAIVICCTLGLFTPQVQAEVIGIEFTPPERIAPGEDLVIAGPVSNGKEIDTIYVYYRMPGSSSYQHLEMDMVANDFYKAIIPAAMLTTEAVEYYIMAIDFLENKQYLLGFPKKPLLTKIATPEVVPEITVPVVPETAPITEAATDDSNSEELEKQARKARRQAKIREYEDKLLDHPLNVGDDPNVILIEKETIRNSGYRTLADILTYIPGFYVAQDEQGRYQVYSQGLDDRSAVTLYINGQMANTLYDGIAMWGMSAQAIEQVTVYVGPAAHSGFHGGLGGAVLVELASGEHGFDLKVRGGGSFSGNDDLSSFAGEQPHRGIYRFDGSGGFTHKNFNMTFFGHLGYGSGVNRLIYKDYLSSSRYSYAPGITNDLPFSTQWGLTGAYNAGQLGVISFGTQLFYLSRGGYIGKIDTMSSPDSSQMDRLWTIFFQHAMAINTKVDYVINLSFKQQSRGQQLYLAPAGYSTGDKNSDGQIESFPNGLIENQAFSEIDAAANLGFDFKLSSKNRLSLAMEIGYAKQLKIDIARNATLEGVALDTITPLSTADFPESTFGRIRAIVNVLDYWQFTNALGLEWGLKLEYFNESAMSGLLFAGRMLHPYARLKWRLRDHLQLALSYRQGSRAPTWQERYSLTGVVAGFTGDQKWAPPVSRQLGLDATHHGLLGNAGFYRLVATVGYQWQQDGLYRLYQDPLPCTLTQLSSHGPLLKLLLRLDFSEHNYLEASAYWWRRQIKEPAVLDTTLPQLTAQLKGSFRLAGWVDITLNGLYVSERRSSGRNQQEILYPWSIGSYFRLDSAIRTVPLWNHVRFGVYTYNTFDADIRDPAPRSGYLDSQIPREGFSVLFGVEVE